MKGNLKVIEKPSWRGDYISPSRLRLWLKCPAAYKRRYVDGIVPPTAPAALVGKAVHAGLEYYYRHQERSVTLFAQYVAEDVRRRWQQMVEAEGVFFPSKGEEEELRQQACRLVVAYIEQLAEEPAPLLVEARLKTPLVDPETGEDLGIPLMGIVDLVLAGPRGPVIVDFKTAARTPAQADLVHELQLTCYSYLVRRLTGQAEEALEIRSLIKTKTPKVVTHCYAPRTAEHYRRLFKVLRAYLQAMDEQREYIRPGIECGYCDFREVCLAA